LYTWREDGRYYNFKDDPHDLVEEVPAPKPALTLREGGYYKARSGAVLGPLKKSTITDFPWYLDRVIYGGFSPQWTNEGLCSDQDLSTGDLNLVEEVPAPVLPENKTTRAQILELARKCVAEDRNNVYGEPKDNFSIVAAYWDIFLASRKSGALRAEEVAQMMVLFKNARLQAKANDIDGWVDMAGYAACGGEVAGAKNDL
jgi:hypothetical protein